MLAALPATLLYLHPAVIKSLAIQLAIQPEHSMEEVLAFLAVDWSFEFGYLASQLLDLRLGGFVILPDSIEIFFQSCKLLVLL